MFHDLVNLIYPKTCAVCEAILTKKDQVICIECLHELPITDYHLDNDNPIQKVFYGRIPIENATSLLLFKKKGSVQNLIHELKYRGNRDIGVFLGKWLGGIMAKLPEYQNIDVIIPVPLHKKKLKVRGYNQVEDFGKEIAKSLNVDYKDHILLKTTVSSSQTIKARLSRWGSLEETFVLNNKEEISGKHILLVDDLITTGATLEACTHILQQAGNIKISVASMAFTG
jgi:competence protein ComFC